MARRRRYRKKRMQQIIAGSAALLAVLALILSVWWFGIKLETHDETLTHEEFLGVIGQYAMDEYATSDVLPSIVTAQAALESDYGASDLSKDYNNLFGYKASPGERSVRMPTKEFQDGEWQTIEDDFKVYRSWRQSVKDHGWLMQHGVSWDHDLYQNVIAASDYETAAYALVNAGYATDPGYAEKLIHIIETYQLDQLDQQVI